MASCKQSVVGLLMLLKHLQEVDPLDGLSDEDIRTAIHNATGPKSALFVPAVSHNSW